MFCVYIHSKQHQYDARRDQLEKWKNSVVADFVGTRSGLLRYQINKNSLLKDKLQFNESPFHAEYFKIPASAYSLTKNENILVFWIPTTKQTTYGGYSRKYHIGSWNYYPVIKWGYPGLGLDL